MIYVPINIREDDRERTRRILGREPTPLEVNLTAVLISEGAPDRFVRPIVHQFLRLAIRYKDGEIKHHEDE